MAEVVLREGPLSGAKVAVLMESDYFEPEIHYYQRRFAEEGAEVHFLTRLWGQPALTFTGHEWRAPLYPQQSGEEVDDDTPPPHAAPVVPSRVGSDPPRHTQDTHK